MKIIIIGMPQSGRTTVAKALCEKENHTYIDAYSWLKNSFRPPREGEHPEQYHDAYHHWYLNRIKEDSNLTVDYVKATISAYNVQSNWVIDGINNPHDFPILFDYNKDFVVFLNRIDNQETIIKDYETIGISVIRDYCFWLSAGGLLSQDKWLEFNFKMAGTDQERVKKMGSKNTVLIVGSLNKVILLLKEYLV